MKRKCAQKIFKKDVVEMTKRIAVMIMLKGDSLIKNQKEEATEKGREVSSTIEELDVKRGLAENEESEDHNFLEEIQF